MGPVLRAIVSLVAVVSLSATPSLMAMCLAWCLPASHAASHVDAAHHPEDGGPDADDHGTSGHGVDHHGTTPHDTTPHDTRAAESSPPGDGRHDHRDAAAHVDGVLSTPPACTCCDDAPAAMAAVNGPRTDGFAAAVAALPLPRRFDVAATFARALPAAPRAPDPSPPPTPLVLRI